MRLVGIKQVELEHPKPTRPAVDPRFRPARCLDRIAEEVAGAQQHRAVEPWQEETEEKNTVFF